MSHAWQFFRAGDVDQVLIASGADLAQLRSLDQKLWVALACPTRGIHFDTRTLDLIDTDGDGRIRAPEIIAACEWACAQLRDPDVLLQAGDRLRLDALADTAEGKLLAEEARHTLALQGRDAQTEDIGLPELDERRKHLAGERLNGDGIVTPATAGDDAALRRLIERIVQTQGGVADAGGTAGVDEAQARAFFEAAGQVLAWHAHGEQDCGPLRAAAQAVDAVHAKLDDYFARCRLATYDPRAAEALSALSPQTLEALNTQTLSLSTPPLQQLPLAPIAPAAALTLAQAHPAWLPALQTLRERAIVPLLGDAQAQVLDEAGWRALQAQVAPCRDWLHKRPTGPVAALGSDVLQAELGDELEALRTRLLALIAQDRDAAPQHGRVDALEKLVRLQRDLVALLRNFVSFEAFYQRQGAVFQAGRLYLDGRSCDLTVRVADAGKHAVVAGLAKTYLAYCECSRGKERQTIAAAFTAGDVDFLFVGRNGVFYDREGHDWDARIVKVIENPISIGQAFLAPYKKFLRMVEEQVAKRAAASDATQQGQLGGWAGRIATADKTPPAAANAPAAATRTGRIDVGTVAALGVALGSISAVLVGVFAKFVDLGWWIPIAVVGIVLSISGPSMLIAWLKLRQRSLGPILDASGWAINGRMRLNVRLGASLSQTAQVPAGTRRRPDPFADAQTGARWLLALLLLVGALVLAWRLDWLPPWRAVAPDRAAQSLMQPSAG